MTTHIELLLGQIVRRGDILTQAKEFLPEPLFEMILGDHGITDHDAERAMELFQRMRQHFDT